MTRGHSTYVEEETQRRDWSLWADWTRYFSWVLLAGCLILLAWTLVFGHRESSLENLEQDVAAGRAHDIETTPGLGRGGHGVATVQVEWRTGVFRYATSVVEARPRDKGRQAAQDDGATGRIGEDLRSHLTAIDPDVVVERVGYPRGWSSSVFWWRIDGWPVWLMGFVWLFTFAMMVSGPDPWRATKSAWFWLMISPAGPIVLIAFLSLGGPTGLAPAPRRGAQRLTGGWAFLLFLVLKGLVELPNR